MKTYLKWAGGKTKIVDTLLSLFPSQMNKYLEPFVGSAAVYLNFLNKYEEDIFENLNIKFMLNDSNYYLINCHKVVADNVDELIAYLDILQGLYDNSKDKKELFSFKKKLLNYFIAINKVMNRDDIILMVSLFIFINKTCFNGLWRVNKKGFFNVPWNQVEDTNIYNKKDILKCSKYLQKASLSSCDFELFIKENVSKGDFVYLDPPYVPLSETSSFTSYTEEKWGKKDTNRLAECLTYIDSVGAKFLMSNSSAEEVLSTFKKWEITYVDVHRFMKPIKAIQNEHREKIKETIVTNY